MPNGDGPEPTHEELMADAVKYYLPEMSLDILFAEIRRRVEAGARAHAELKAKLDSFAP